MIHALISVLAGLLAGTGTVWGLVTWLTKGRTQTEPTVPTVTPSQVAMLKEIGKPPPKPPRNRMPGWFGRPTRNQQLIAAVGLGYSNVIKAATEHRWTPKEKIALARQAYAQNAITIDELERVIENAIKEDQT